MSHQTPKDHRRVLWDSLPCGMFINMSVMESFRASYPSILMKIRPSVAALPLVDHEIGALPFGSLKLVTCGDVPVAYNLVAPRCKTRVGKNYATLIRAPSSEVKRLFLDGTMVILGDDAAIVALIQSKRWLR